MRKYDKIMATIRQKENKRTYNDNYTTKKNKRIKNNVILFYYINDDINSYITKSYMLAYSKISTNMNGYII